MEQNILNTLNTLVVNITDSTIDPFHPDLETSEIVREELSMLREVLGLTALQSALLGLVIESAAGKQTSYRNLAGDIGCSYLELMSHVDDFHVLCKKGYLRINHEQLSVSAEAMAALMKNRAYERAEPTGLNTEAQLAKMKRYLNQVRQERMSENLFLEEMERMIRCNPETSLGLGFTKHIAPLNLKEYERYLFYLALYGARFYGNKFSIEDVRDYFSDASDYEEGLYWLTHCYQQLDLFIKHIFEEVSADGLVEEDQFKIRDDIVEDFLKEASVQKAEQSIWLEDSAKFTPKELFYNQPEKQQVQRLSALLSPDNLNRVFESMVAKGMRAGFTCLFYGAPGTGKTETALQLARATGRKVLSADMARILSKWVGESEQNARRLFRDYQIANAENERTPILLLNEADAFLGKRFTNVRNGSEKMENGLQNIFLEELERFTGILIATTNLTTNLDPAFERRFLFKIRFDKPGTDVSATIWRSIIPELSEEEAGQLAATYTFSGGQIENIARKRNIDAILTGAEPDFAAICQYCKEETLSHTPAHRPIGF